MAAASQSNMERFKAENHTAFVVGYTGEVGKALVKDLSELKIFKKVLLLGRREIPLDVGPEIVSYAKLTFIFSLHHCTIWTHFANFLTFILPCSLSNPSQFSEWGWDKI